MLRLLIAALRDSGPCSVKTWADRSGIRENHVLTIIRMAEGQQAIKSVTGPEGIRLLVQPESFWRERPLTTPARWAESWARMAAQTRLDLVTERPGLNEMLAASSSIVSSPRTAASLPLSGEGERDVAICGATMDGRKAPAGGVRISEKGIAPKFGQSGSPKFGDVAGQSVPLNGQRLNGPGKDLKTLNAERLTGAGWIEPETERAAIEACRSLLGELEMVNWGGAWRNRWRSNPDGLRKVLNMVREDQDGGRKSDNWGRTANYLWKKFVER